MDLQFTWQTMANSEGRVFMDEDQARATEERYAQMEATLQKLWQQNRELMARVQEQENIMATERLRADRRSRAQMQ